jgi:hypothetical protein
MSSRRNRFFLAFLITASIMFNSCAIGQNEPGVLQSSPTITSIFTHIPATVTLTFTSTLTPILTETLLPTVTGTFEYPLPTLPPDCGTVNLGHAGTQIIDNSENVLLQGTAILCGQIYFSLSDRPRTISVPEAMIDLDTGTIDSGTADIEFCPGAGSDVFYYLCNINNVLMKAYGFAGEKQVQPTFEDCSEISKPFESTNDNEPKYACVITNSGNVARIKTETPNPLGKFGLAWEISFITWKK